MTRELLLSLSLTSLAQAETPRACCWISFADRPHAGVVRDQSGAGHDATLHGAQWIEGRALGSCLSFDGRGQYAELHDSQRLNFATSLTISAVARVEGTRVRPPVVGAIVAKWTPTGEPQTMSYALLQDENTFRLRLSDGRKQ